MPHPVYRDPTACGPRLRPVARTVTDIRVVIADDHRAFGEALEIALDRERDVHQHIGDCTLVMAGVFPEYLPRLKTAGMVYRKDFLEEYVKTRNRSYGL